MSVKKRNISRKVVNMTLWLSMSLIQTNNARVYDYHEITQIVWSNNFDGITSKGICLNRK